MKDHRIVPTEACASAIDLPLGDSVALQRLVVEVADSRWGPPRDTTLYNRTYHRHNR